MFAGKKSAQIREILINESAWEEMTCLFAPSLEKLDALDADEQAAMCERLHELAEELQNSIQIRFEAESETGT
ncbi:Rop family plasmid primer RNA-binding protein [Escherichia coli]|nr:Rop family plasmid primer RNA-binding protein [Escherichia coli]EGC9248835.1 Rop family plasmid primer RNA-binding protein [Escherichia coli]